MSVAASSNDPAHPTEQDCRFCWMCRHVCPVGHVTKRETLTPHAWALLIDAVRRGTMTWNAETADVLYQCADCGLCRTHCITDRPLPEAIALARAEAAAAGHAPQAAYAWRDASDERARHATASAGRLAPPPEGGSAATGTGVALFLGEAMAQNAASVGAALTLLAAAGVRPTRIGDTFSNGVTASALGFPDRARAQAQAVVSAVTSAGSTQVLVLGSSDHFAFARLYGERLGVAWPEQVKVTEVTTVLAEAVAEGRLRFTTRSDGPAYAYHDPCQSPRIRRDPGPPRALLSAALGEARRLFWREERAHPCGSVGALALTHPEVAAQLSDARLADAAEAGASLLVTEDPGCLQHLQSRSTTGVSVVGLYELLAGQLAS
jgi:Fe-S oxidoreductase